MAKVLFTGAKPSGTLHLGNYFGFMEPSILQANDAEKSYLFIADLHALTSIQNPEKLKESTLHLAAGYLACGLDPERTIIFKQSDISEHSELAWIFDCITTMPYLMRAHAYKDAEAKNAEINVGVFNYPMLMSADILLYDTNIVPVGSDQKQHVEYARDTAQKFNRIFGELFVLPEAKITDGVGIVPGIDGRKMSKSYGNVIPLFDSEDSLKEKIMSIVTDSKGADEPKDPNTCNIFAMHKLFASPVELANLEKRYREGSISYKESKEMLYEEATRLLSPMRDKYNQYINDSDKLLKILKDGGENAKEVASNKMKSIRKLVGLDF